VLFSKWSEFRWVFVDEALHKLEKFLLSSSFFCETSESYGCEWGLASAGGDVMAPLQQQVVLISEAVFGIGLLRIKHS